MLPSSWPNRTARSDPAASITARRPSTPCSSASDSTWVGRSESPDPRPVEQDQTGDGSELVEERSELRHVPTVIDVGHPARREDQVDWSLTKDLVGDGEAIDGLRVAGLR